MGSISWSIGKSGRLQNLVLSNKNLNGTIPKQVLNMVSLKQAALDRYSFTGSLQMDVGKLRNLGILDVSNNKLSGEIPNSLGSSITLEAIYMEGNFSQGSIPSSVSA